MDEKCEELALKTNKKSRISGNGLGKEYIGSVRFTGKNNSNTPNSGFFWCSSIMIFNPSSHIETPLHVMFSQLDINSERYKRHD